MKGHAALLFILGCVLLSTAGCKEPAKKPAELGSVGEPCAPEGAVRCTGKNDSVSCVDGKVEATPCRDGCAPLPTGDQCSNKEYVAGEYCVAWDEWHSHACSVDLKSKLRCSGKHWVLENACPGKEGCRWVRTPIGRRFDEHIECDEVVTEKGLPCPTEDRHACTSDGKLALRCRSGAWTEDQPCRGPEGCIRDGERIRCDDTLADVGDSCGEDGDRGCSIDKKALLVCKSKKMAIDKRCKSSCTVITDKVRSGRPGPRFECD